MKRYEDYCDSGRSDYAGFHAWPPCPRYLELGRSTEGPRGGQVFGQDLRGVSDSHASDHQANLSRQLPAHLAGLHAADSPAYRSVHSSPDVALDFSLTPVGIGVRSVRSEPKAAGKSTSGSVW